MMYDMIIVGAGTAGLTAAIYGARAGKKVLLLEKFSYGGQIIVSPCVENYPGIQEISGFSFATALYEQMMSYGVRIIYEEAVKLSELPNGIEVQTKKQSYQGKILICATGTVHKRLGLEGEKRLIGKGISYCASCDGMFYKGKKAAVIGGGNTALLNACTLSEYCKEVLLIHRREAFRGEQALQDRVKMKENIHCLMESEVIALKGDSYLEALQIWQKGKSFEQSVDGCFISIGQKPDHEWLRSYVPLDENGYVITDECCRTGNPRILAAGDGRRKTVRQLVTAASDGAIAAETAVSYLTVQDSLFIIPCK